MLTPSDVTSTTVAMHVPRWSKYRISHRPVRLSIVVPCTGSRGSSSSPLFPGNGSLQRHLPSLLRVPVSPVPRSHRHYEGATTSHSRINGRLLVSLPPPTRSLPHSCLALALLEARRSLPGRGLLLLPAALLRLLSRGREWDLPGLQAIHPVPLLRSRTPVEPTCPRQYRSRRCCPRIPDGEGFGENDFGANPQLWHLLPYASRVALPHTCKACFRLAGCAFAGRESNPLDRDDRFQLVVTIILLSCSPGATGIHNHRPGVMDSGLSA
jgi:hypothetical protein